MEEGRNWSSKAHVKTTSHGTEKTNYKLGKITVPFTFSAFLLTTAPRTVSCAYFLIMVLHFSGICFCEEFTNYILPKCHNESKSKPSDNATKVNDKAHHESSMYSCLPQLCIDNAQPVTTCCFLSKEVTPWLKSKASHNATKWMMRPTMYPSIALFLPFLCIDKTPAAFQKITHHMISP